MKIGFLKRKSYKGTEIVVYQQRAFDAEAELAAQMIERWGMSAAIEDGEDSAGRAKIRLLTPEELVQRACETAEQAMEEFNKRGWILDLPELTGEDDDA